LFEPVIPPEGEGYDPIRCNPKTMVVNRHLLPAFKAMGWRDELVVEVEDKGEVDTGYCPEDDIPF